MITQTNESFDSRCNGLSNLITSIENKILKKICEINKTHDNLKCIEICDICGVNGAHNWNNGECLYVCGQDCPEKTSHTELSCDTNCLICQTKGIQHSEPVEYSWNENNHWYNCTKCGAEIKEKHINRVSDHKYDADKHWRYCGICNYEFTSSSENHLYNYSQIKGDNWEHNKYCSVCKYTVIESHLQDIVKIIPLDNSQHQITTKCKNCDFTRTQKSNCAMDDFSRPYCAICRREMI